MFADYLRELQKVRLLTPAEEAGLWERYRRLDDSESRLRLIEAYQPLVFKLAMQVRPAEAVMMDAIQEGTIGLIEAVERFDPGRGVRFSTFAMYRIRGRILNAFGRRRPPELSLDQVLAEDVAAGLALGDVQAEMELLDVEDRVFVEQVREAIDALPEREQSILRAYLAREEPRQVAMSLRISLSHLYRLQKQAIERVRRAALIPLPAPEAS